MYDEWLTDRSWEAIELGKFSFVRSSAKQCEAVRRIALRRLEFTHSTYSEPAVCSVVVHCHVPSFFVGELIELFVAVGV